MSINNNDPHVYAEIELIIQHDVVARPARCWTTTQWAMMPGELWTHTSFETRVALKIEVRLAGACHIFIHH
jgi:hypothetical protein